METKKKSEDTPVVKAAETLGLIRLRRPKGSAPLPDGMWGHFSRLRAEQVKAHMDANPDIKRRAARKATRKAGARLVREVFGTRKAA